MISYSLVCDNSHKFDAWFKSAAAYDDQHSKGVVTCPVCTSGQVEKAVMAPAVSRTDSGRVSLSAGHPEARQLREMMRALRHKVTSEADYVGDKFADEARKIHFKEVDPRGIYGEATHDEVAGLLEDDLVAHADDRVERRHRVLEHHPDLAAADRPQVPVRQREQVAAVEPGLAGDVRGRRGQQPDQDL